MAIDDSILNSMEQLFHAQLTSNRERGLTALADLELERSAALETLQRNFDLRKAEIERDTQIVEDGLLRDEQAALQAIRRNRRKREQQGHQDGTTRIQGNLDRGQLRMTSNEPSTSTNNSNSTAASVNQSEDDEHAVQLNPATSAGLGVSATTPERASHSNYPSVWTEERGRCCVVTCMF